MRISWYNIIKLLTIGCIVKYLPAVLLFIAILIVSITFGANNGQIVAFNFLLAQGDFRLSTLLSVLFGVGFILGWAICGLFWLRVRLKLASSQRKLKRLQQQQLTAVSDVQLTTLPSNE